MRIGQLLQSGTKFLRGQSTSPEGGLSKYLIENTEGIQQLCYSSLNYPNENHFLAFRSYVRVSNLAYHLDCKNVLEIGAGLSTALWARFAERTGAQICTVDADFERLESRVGNTQDDGLLRERVRFVKGTTIRADELVRFYSRESKSSFGGIEVVALAEHLDLFRSRDCPDWRWREVRRLGGRKSWSVRDLVVSQGKLAFSRQLLDLFSMDRDFDREVAFLEEAGSQETAGVLGALIAEGNSWDLVFFDSGELSSMIEWLNVKDHIAIGGLAAFHDIFFPKSIKNVVVCASVLADPNWEVVFVDDSTKQGLLVAQRLQ